LQVDFGDETTMLPMTGRDGKNSLATIKSTAKNPVGMTPQSVEQRPN
jgi:hypothetical protein